MEFLTHERPLHNIFQAITLASLPLVTGDCVPGVEQRVRQIIAGQLGLEVSAIADKAAFVEDLGADSLDQVELIMALEETFDLEIPDEEAEKIATVHDVVDYIEKNAKSVKQ